MRTSRKLAQKMKYALSGTVIPKYSRDEYNQIIYFTDSEGNRYPMDTGETEIGFNEPIEFEASINNKLDEVLMRSYGIDDSTNYAQITAPKNYLPLKAGSVIWKQSDVKYRDDGLFVDDKSADYIVKGVADEGLEIDLFLLQKIVK